MQRIDFYWPNTVFPRHLYYPLVPDLELTREIGREITDSASEYSEDQLNALGLLLQRLQRYVVQSLPLIFNVPTDEWTVYVLPLNRVWKKTGYYKSLAVIVGQTNEQEYFYGCGSAD